MLSSQQLYRARAVRVSVHSFQPCTFASDRTAAAPDIRAHSLPAVQLQLRTSVHIRFRPCSCSFIPQSTSVSACAVAALSIRAHSIRLRKRRQPYSYTPRMLPLA